MTAIKYAFFAALSIIVNLVFQSAIRSLYTGFGTFYLSLATGTLAGLAFKYILDKQFIFYHKTNGIKDGVGNFALYSLMGVWTTIIFWGCEIAFHYSWKSPLSQYIGGAIGLLFGYAVKFSLDKRYVFKKI